jgi:hypothetical protein
VKRKKNCGEAILRKVPMGDSFLTFGAALFYYETYDESDD